MLNYRIRLLWSYQQVPDLDPHRWSQCHSPQTYLSLRTSLCDTGSFHSFFLNCNVAGCGSGMFIPDPNFFHPGSRTQGQKDSGSGSASKNLSILTQKIVSKLSEKWSGMFIPDPDPGSSFRIRIPYPVLDFFYSSRIPNPGSRVQKDTGSRIRIRNTAVNC